MSDKVYPVLSDGERHGRPSAPPITLANASSAAVALQIPEEKLMHNEQEKSLILSYHNQTHACGDETIYGWPPGRSAAATGIAAARGGRRGRRGGCWCRCVASFLGTLAAIVVIVGVAALVLYLVLKPKAPKFSVTKATVNEFNVTTGPPAGMRSSLNVNTDVVLSVEARNPNKKISILYGDVTVALLYADQQIGHGSISAFLQPHRNITFLTLPIQGHQMPLASSSGAALQSSVRQDGSIPLQANAVSMVRVKVGHWKSKRFKVHVICSLKLSKPISHVSVLSESCKLKIKFGYITVTF